MARDTQRSKLYTAEHVLIGHGKTFDTVPEMQNYVNAMIRTRWWKNRYRLNRITVLDGRMRRRGGGGFSYWVEWGVRNSGYAVKMPRRTRTEYYLLHEVAHCLAPNTAAGHGPQFCRVYLDLVERFMGKEEARLLRESFREHKVRTRITKRRTKRVLSDEERQVLAERLKRGRETAARNREARRLTDEAAA